MNRYRNIELGRIAGLVVGTILLLQASAAMAVTKQEDWRVEWAQHVADNLVTKMTEACPLADPGDQAAYDDCRAKVFASEAIADEVADYILWGGGKIDVALRDRSLTQFGKKIWIGLYLPLFMFTGDFKTQVNEEGNWMLLRAEVRFRNLLKPGQYPYPFWHDESKWNAYQEANELVFTLDLRNARVIGVQRSPFGTGNPELDQKLTYAMKVPPRKFNKDEWMWKDQNGVPQPKVTLFDGLYAAENPYLRKLEAAYTAFAVEMRDNNCMVCHVPNNPEKMKNLILLQTPAHAAGEIDRIIRVVRADAMPAKSWAGPKSIEDPKAKERFLDFARAFKAQVDAAAAWDLRNGSTQ